MPSFCSALALPEPFCCLHTLVLHLFLGGLERWPSEGHESGTGRGTPVPSGLRGPREGKDVPDPQAGAALKAPGHRGADLPTLPQGAQPHGHLRPGTLRLPGQCPASASQAPGGVQHRPWGRCSLRNKGCLWSCKPRSVSLFSDTVQWLLGQDGSAPSTPSRCPPHRRGCPRLAVFHTPTLFSWAEDPLAPQDRGDQCGQKAARARPWACMSPQAPLPGSGHRSSQPRGPVNPLNPDPQPSHLCLQGAPAAATLQGQPRAAGGAPGPAGPAGLRGGSCLSVPGVGGGGVAVCLTALGFRPPAPPRGPPDTLPAPCGHIHRTAGSLHVHTGRLGTPTALSPGGRGSRVRVARRQAAAAPAGWRLPASSWPTCLEGRLVPGEALAPARLARGGVRESGSKAAGLRP